MIQIVCPECGSRNYSMNRYVTIAYLYEVNNGYVQASGLDDDDADYVRTRCVCRECGRRWTTKGDPAFSIDE